VVRPWAKTVRPELSQGRLALLLMAPSVVVLAALLVYPLVYSFSLSLQSYNPQFPQYNAFVGLSNYLTALADPDFQATLWRTLGFTLVSVLLEFLLGLSFAMLLDQAFWGRRFFRAVVLVPWSMLTISNALLWLWILNPSYGALNALLFDLGLIHHYQGWQDSPLSAMATIILADVWKLTPFMTLLLLAALQSLPRDLHRAAEIDGANAWQRFWHVTLPQLRPAILVVLVLRSLDAFRIFDLIYVMTGGGPADATKSMSLLIYRSAFQGLQLSYGAALAYLTTAIILVGIVGYMFALQSEN
jgi:ABC-type sugar transport system permease subunit